MAEARPAEIKKEMMEGIMKKKSLLTFCALLLISTNVAFADSISVNDVLYEGEVADAISPLLDGNTFGEGDNSLNEFLGFEGDEFQFIAKAEDENNYSDSGAFGQLILNINFEGVVETDPETGEEEIVLSSGTWILDWTGSIGLPTSIDFVIGLKSDQSVGYYFFNDKILTSSPTFGEGEYTVNISVNDNNKLQDLSHMDLYARAGAPIPEPGTMLLFGTGLAGLAAVGRRRKN